MDRKLKVVWICHFSNAKIRDNIRFSRFYYKRIIDLIRRKPDEVQKDFAVWNTNAIKEFEKYNNIKLTVIFPHVGIKNQVQSFSIDGVDYYCFRSQNDNLLSYLKTKLFGWFETNYKDNRKVINRVVASVNPDIVHVIGAENPYYSIAALDVPKRTPLIVSLQTLMSAPGFFENYPTKRALYDFRVSLEKQIIKRCTRVFSGSDEIIRNLKEVVSPDIIVEKNPLAVGVEINDSCCDKTFDFVYFAANINKACDLAIEAFAIACNLNSNLTLNISGGYTSDYKQKIDARLEELAISDKVVISGQKNTHSEVLQQIRKSRFALLPLKVDLISGTIREAMACGLPVVTTKTPATPELNRIRESVLISPVGDHVAMANNMIKLVEDKEYAETIRKNAIVTIRETYSNSAFMKKWHDSYIQLLDN